jgi:hypothetical protein
VTARHHAIKPGAMAAVFVILATNRNGEVSSARAAFDRRELAVAVSRGSL